MSQALDAFLFSVCLAAVLTPLVREGARRWGYLDHALSSRKVHGRPLPRLGGIAIVLAFYGALAAMCALGLASWSLFEDPRTASLLLGGLVVALLGLYDDLRGTGARQKFVVQFAVAFAMYSLGFRIEALSNPFGDTLQLGVLSLPFTLLWFVGLTNAFNLIDGLDGLAGGVALIAIATNVVMTVSRGETTLVVVSMALAGAVLGFLFYNFNPASIFMGDTGSMFLGFVIATLSLAVNQKSSTAVAILIPVTALGLPILDTALAFLRRAVRGEPVFRADREHIHHQLLARGLSHRQAVLSLYALSVFLGAMAIALNRASPAQAVAILGVVVAVLFPVLSRLGYLGLVRAAEDQARSSPGSRAEEMRLLGHKLRFCERPEQVWEIVKSAGDSMGADCVRLSLDSVTAEGESTTRSFAIGYDRLHADLFRARFPLQRDGVERGALELGWRHADQQLRRADEEAIERLCAEICLAIGQAPLAARERRRLQGG